MLDPEWAEKPTHALLVFLLLAALFFAPGLAKGQVFYPADFLYRTPAWYNPDVPLQNFDLFDVVIMLYPHDRLLNESLKRGVLPLWNPYNYCGHPIMADGTSGYLYPPRLLAHWLLSVEAAHTLISFVHLWLCGFTMWMLARRLKVSGPGSLLAGLAWMFNGYNTTWFEYEYILILSMGLPLLLIALDRARRESGAVPWVALVSGLLLLGAPAQGFLYCLIIAAGFCGWRMRTEGDRWPALLRLGTGLGLGLLLALPLLLPLRDTVLDSQRPIVGLDFLQRTFRSYLLTFLPTIFAPDTWGNPVQAFSMVRVPNAGNFIYSELCVYEGIIPLLLAVVGARQRGAARFLFWLAVVALVLPATPLYALLYRLPAVSRLIATRDAYIWQFSVSLLAGFGWDALRPSRALAWLAGVMCSTWIAMVAAVHAFEGPLLSWLLETHRVRLPVRDLFLSDDAWMTAVRDNFHAFYAWNSAAVFLPILWLVLSAGVLIRPRFWLVFAVGAADLLCFGLRFNPTVPVGMIYPPCPTTEFLQAHAGNDRVLSVGTIKPDTLMPYRLYDPGGYEALYPRRVALYMGLLMYGPSIGERLNDLPAQVFPIPTASGPLVDLLGARYCVAYPGQDLPGKKLVAETPLRIYENPTVLPRAFVVFKHEVDGDWLRLLARLATSQVNARDTVLFDTDPIEVDQQGTGRADITEYDLHQVTIKASATAPGWLVLTDTWTADWEATVDGAPAAVLPAYHTFRAVHLPAGDHTVVFRYHCRSFILGLWISGATLLALAAWLLTRQRGAGRPARPWSKSEQ